VTGKRLLRLPATIAKVTLSHSEIYDRMAKGTFPKQVHLGPKTSAWLESELDEWIDAQVAARDAGTKPPVATVVKKRITRPGSVARRIADSQSKRAADAAA
jgi:prophage regulatory protein